MVHGKHEKTEAKSLAVVFLAAGYGTRIRKDLQTDSQFSHLALKPKPLLPLAGLPLISHWLPHLSHLPSLVNITVITNSTHYPLYHAWAEQLRSGNLNIPLPPVQVICDSSTSNETRYGAVHDLHIALSHIDREAPHTETALVIAADTLLPTVKLLRQLQHFEESGSPLAVFAYKLSDMSDSVRRGMLGVRKHSWNGMVATELVEKPVSPDLAPSSWATAPVYLFRRKTWSVLSTFLSESAAEPIERRDAPGHLLAWLIPKMVCHILPVPERIDIGRLSHYKFALHHYTLPPLPPPKDRLPDEPAVGRAFPRIGLLGNPSDMYNGKVIAVAIASEGFAEVVATPADKFSVELNPQHELPQTFDHFSDFVSSIETRGVHYGARQLVLAAAVAFAKKFASTNHPEKKLRDAIAHLPNCRLSYSTTIPPRIGLSGSSALILATWRSMSRFFNTSLDRIDGNLSTWPLLLRSVEMDELGITCGLMDRVVQVMQGCVAMDFTSGLPGVWSGLPEHMLPDLYLVYYRNAIGECSGNVHGRSSKRIRLDDSEIERVASELAKCADVGAELLLRAKGGNAVESVGKLSALFERNFELRCHLLGMEAVGDDNLKLVNTARKAGFSAKLSGSGGCVVCVPKPVRVLSNQEELRAEKEFDGCDMVFRKVRTLKQLKWCS